MCEIEILTCAKMAQFTTELVHEMKFIVIIIFVFGINFLNQFTYGRLIKQDGGKFIPSQRIPLVPKFIPRNFPNAIELIKQRKDSRDLYQKENRIDLAEKESNEIKIIEEFLPEQMSDVDL